MIKKETLHDITEGLAWKVRSLDEQRTVCRNHTECEGCPYNRAYTCIARTKEEDTVIGLLDDKELIEEALERTLDLVLYEE